NAMIDMEGNPTELYEYVREANLYLRPAGSGLIGWDNEFIARYEKGEMLPGGSSPIAKPTGNEAHLIVGTFTRGHKRRVVISNSRCETIAKFSLNISPGWQVDAIVTSMDATPSNNQEPGGDWILEAGGSVILELKPKS
ncbi:unnamed protein product, partial [marine sediment metagenome]